MGSAGSGRAVGASASSGDERWRGERRRRAVRNVRSSGAPLAAISGSGADLFPLLRHSGPIFHMVSYAMLCGVPAMAAVSIYSVEGLAGLGGRLLLGVLADRLGVK